VWLNFSVHVSISQQRKFMKNKDTVVAYRRIAIITPVFVQRSGSLIFVTHSIKFSGVLNMGIFIENIFCTEDARTLLYFFLICDIPIASCKNMIGFTYLLSPLNRVLLEKLNGSQTVKKFPAFYGTRRFISTFTRARHLSLP
jgi:hypothetical protein